MREGSPFYNRAHRPSRHRLLNSGDTHADQSIPRRLRLHRVPGPRYLAITAQSAKADKTRLDVCRCQSRRQIACAGSCLGVTAKKRGIPVSNVLYCGICRHHFTVRCSVLEIQGNRARTGDLNLDRFV
ncbi:hypothetical protein BDV10DRAFT_174599 [Aspergillus recurvatus]